MLRRVTDRLINLHSDTQTRPTTAMREAMAAAEVGDEQRRQDPTVNRLQDRVAELLGHEAAVFLPTGTMCNLSRSRPTPAPATRSCWSTAATCCGRRPAARRP